MVTQKYVLNHTVHSHENVNFDNRLNESKLAMIIRLSGDFMKTKSCPSAQACGSGHLVT